MLEILVLLALAQQQQGDVETAVTTVARALELAEPEGYLATFTDEGPAMAALLSAAAKRGVSTAYVARLLRSQGPGPLEPPRGSDVLVDPLSERELDVLRLLASELSGRRSPGTWSCPSTRCARTPRASTPSSASGTRRAAVRRGRGPRTAPPLADPAGPPRGSPHVVIRAPHVGS